VTDRRTQTDVQAHGIASRGSLLRIRVKATACPWIAAGGVLLLALAVSFAVDVVHEQRTWSIARRTEQPRLGADAVPVRAVTSARRTALRARTVTRQRVVA